MATMTFQWAGKNVKGAIENGEMAASSKDEVIQKLKAKRIVATSVVEKQKKGLKLSFGGGKVSDKDIVVFTRQFSTMIDAGLPLVQALSILSEQSENPTMRTALIAIKGDVESGSTYADALKKHPKVFDELYANMCAAGEAGGILDTILQRLATYIEKAAKIKKQIKGAMTYPIVVSSIALLVVAVIMIWVVPTFTEMFASLGGVLPLPTRIVVAISDFMKNYVLLLGGGLFGAITLLKYIRSTPRGQYEFDRIFMKAPIFGPLVIKTAVSKFTRTMGTLTSSGVPILDGLEITAKTAGNKVLEKAIMDVRQAVSEGKTLAEPLTKAKVFPEMVTHMIAVGEATGALDTMLSKIADFYDEEVDQAVGNLTAMMEPLLMVFLGTVVGFVIIAMYLPIFKMITLVGN